MQAVFRTTQVGGISNGFSLAGLTVERHRTLSPHGELSDWPASSGGVGRSRREVERDRAPRIVCRARVHALGPPPHVAACTWRRPRGVNGQLHNRISRRRRISACLRLAKSTVGVPGRTARWTDSRT